MGDTCHSDAIAYLCYVEYVENYFIYFIYTRQSLTLIKIQAPTTGEKCD
jgi:hypothetical protein